MSYFYFGSKKIYYTVEGVGKPLLMLHGNTASSKMFDSIVSLFSEKNKVIRMDFLGCGQSERIDNWPVDLWYEWGEEAAALLRHLKLKHINVIGCSGGALAALNLAIEHPNLVNAIVADSFEGIEANANVTEQIRIGRNWAKKIEDFRVMQKGMHGEDWEMVLDADTDAVIRHAQTVKNFFHKPLSSLESKLLLTGSAEDEMFPPGHYEKLFKEIASDVNLCSIHIFAHGKHPALLSNINEYKQLLETFF